MKIRKSFYAFIHSLTCLFIFQGCGEKVGGVPMASLNFSTAGGLQSTMLASEGLGVKSESVVVKVISQGNSEIIIEKASFMIRRIKLKRASEPQEERDLKTDPIVVTLNLDDLKHAATISEIQPGTYDRIKFEIHKLESSESASIDLSANPQFTEFVSDNGYSIIVKGTYDDDITDNIPEKSFEFKSRFNEIQHYELTPPLVITADQTIVDINLEINMDEWFIVDDQLVDPEDKKFESNIEGNIKNSIRYF